jgi:hypothetical protein
MAKYIPFSIVAFSILFAGYLSARPRGKQAMKTLHVGMVIFLVVWGLLCLNVYAKYVVVE